MVRSLHAAEADAGPMPDSGGFGPATDATASVTE
jgi:hypothetical protein